MEKNPNLKTPLAKSSLMMMFVMLTLIVAGLIGSGVIFSGYLGGGRSGAGVFQAFLLCFGVGALVYLPAAAVFAIARSVRANGPNRKFGLLATFLALPVWGYGAAVMMIYPGFWIWGGLALLIGLYVSFWAVFVIRHGR
jgi:hypothetical protein